MTKIYGTHICTECGFQIEWHGYLPHLLSSPESFHAVSREKNKVYYSLPAPKDGMVAFKKRCPKCDKYQWFKHAIDS